MSGSLSDYRPSVAEAKIVFQMIVNTFVGNKIAAGSLYRNWDHDFETVGDVDVVLVETDAERASNNEIFATLFGRYKNGNVRTMGVLGRVQVDFFRCTSETAGAVALFYCVPRPLQLALRCIANVKGFRFGPKGLFELNEAQDELIPTVWMHEVFDRLGVSTFSKTELRKAADYKYKEPMNLP